MTFVLDNSIALAGCFKDGQTEPLMALLDRLTEQGAVVPQLWPIDALNGLLTAERRGRIDGQDRQRLAGFLQDLPIAIDDETARRVWAMAAQLAERHRLTAYNTSCHKSRPDRAGVRGPIWSTHYAKGRGQLLRQRV